MAVFLPALKIALPYITQIVTAAVPMFTSKPPGGRADEIVPKQIQELQTAVTHNAESVKGLALQMKETMEGVDSAAARLQAEIRALRRIVYGSLTVAIVACVAALAALVGR